jgi:5-methylcytosine-specific restriction endonuclease McrA
MGSQRFKNKRRNARKFFWNYYTGSMNCCYCGVTVSRQLDDGNFLKATIEHVVPLSKGGVNRMSNMRVACWQCNNEKSN